MERSLYEIETRVHERSAIDCRDLTRDRLQDAEMELQVLVKQLLPVV